MLHGAVVLCCWCAGVGGGGRGPGGFSGAGGLPGASVVAVGAVLLLLLSLVSGFSLMLFIRQSLPMLSASICSADFIDLFEEEATDSILINYGERFITSRQMFAQIFLDLRWALLSIVLAGVMLRIGSGSTFMTLAGVFQIIVRPFRS